MARSRRQKPSTPVNALRSFLRVDKLEDRLNPDNGLWLTVFSNMPSFPTPQAQETYTRNLFTSSGVTPDEVLQLRALDLAGTFVIETPDGMTLPTITTELQAVSGFQFVSPYTTVSGNGTLDEAQKRALPVVGRSANQFGPFSYQGMLDREAHGKLPGQGGVVPDDVDPADVLTNNNGGATGTALFTQSETSVVAFGNTVIVGYNDSGSNAGGTNKFTGFSRSTDGGVTFTDGGTLPTNAGGDAGDPVIARNETTGRLYFSTLGFSTSTIQVFRSDDNGATWQAPVNGTPGGSTEDKQWITVDNFAGAGNGNVYLISRNFGAGNGIYLYRSTDNGATFGPTGGTFITAGSQGAFVTVGTDHSVHAYWFAGSTIQMRRSTDNGATFGPAVTVASGLVGGVNGDLGLTGVNNGETTARSIRSSEFPHAYVNPVSGAIYVTYNNRGTAVGDKGDVFLVQSLNNGATWSAPVKVNDDATTTDQWMPTLAVSPDGTKLIVSYYSREVDTTTADGDPVNNQFRYFARLADISGATITFSPSFAVSPVNSKPEVGRDSLINSVYMGDYNQTAATPGAFHLVYSDNRDLLPGGGGRSDPNVYYAKVTTAPTFFVTTTTPANGSTIGTFPVAYTVNFNAAYTTGTVQASDFRVNGVPANSVTLVDADTLQFNYLSTPAVEGVNTMAIAAGDITGNGSLPITAFSGTFRVDTVPLAITTTNPAPGSIITLGPVNQTIRVFFNEVIAPGTVQLSDFAISAGTVISATPVLGNTAVDIVISGLTVEGTLDLTINAGAFTDVNGGANPVGFTAKYVLDYVTRAYPAPLAAKAPAGSLIYDPSIAGLINFIGDQDNFTLNIDPGQTISVIVTPTTPFPSLVAGVGNGGGANAGGLLLLNQGTGAGTLLGDPVTPGGLTGLAYDATTGVLFGSTISGGVSQLVRINPVTGALLSTVGFITAGSGGPIISIGDLAMQPGTGVLYGIRSNASGGGGLLYTINKTTGVATLIGDTQASAGGGIAFAPDGSLYQTSFGDSFFSFYSLNKLNPANAARISTVALPTYFDGLAIRSDGTFFGTEGGAGADTLYTINPTTGAITPLGGTGLGSVSDIEFLRDAVQPRVELFDPSNASLGFATAPAGGQVTGIQTRATTTGGTYTFAITGANGTTGGYTVQVILNAAFELEGRVVGATNDTAGTAQNIDGSFLNLDTTVAHATRGAALATTDTSAGYTATAVAFGFTNISGTGSTILVGVDDTAATVTLPFAFNFYGTSYTQLFASSNGLITFGTANTAFSNATLSANPTQAAIAPFWDDLYVFGANSRVLSQVIGAVGSRQLILQWDQVNFFPSTGADTLTFQVILSEGTNTIRFNYLDLDSEGGSTFSANAGIKAAGSPAPQFLEVLNNGAPNALVGTGKSTLFAPALPTADFYSFAATAGQRVTVALTNLTTGNVDVQLIAPNGTTVLASGVAGATNLNEAISNFLIGATGTYFLRITGDSTVPYSVVVMKDAAFDAEANNTQATAQSLGGSQGALGYAQGGSGTSSNFETGQQGWTINNSIPGIGTGLWHLSTRRGGNPGHSAVTSFYYGSESSGTYDTGVRNAGAIISPTFLVSAGSNLSFNYFLATEGTGSYDRATVEVTTNGGTSWTVLGLLNQAGAFTAQAFSLNSFAGLNAQVRFLFDTVDSIANAFEGWYVDDVTIGNSPDTDWYSIALGAGETALEVETKTPADGAGEFVNLLNPKVEVFNAAGVLVGTGVVQGDGRNEKVRITGLTAGATYFIKVSGEGITAGEYFVGAKALRAPVITSQVDDATPFGTGPDGTFKVPVGTTNGWTNVTGSGYLNDYTVHQDNVNETAANFAQWTIRITSTNPELFTTWVARPTNATNATYQVYLGTTLLSTVVVNQQLSPNDAVFGSTLIESLGSFVVPTGTMYLSVRLLTAGANGDVVADAVFDPPAGEIARVGPAAGGETTNTGSSIMPPDSMTKAMIPSAPIGAGKTGVTVQAGVRPTVATVGLGTESTVLAPTAAKLVSIGRPQTTPPESTDATAATVTKPLAPAVITIAPPAAGWFNERIWVDANKADEIIDLT